MRRLNLVILSVLLAFAAACGGERATKPASPSSAGTAAAPSSGATAPAAVQPKGELRIAAAFLVANLDVTKNGFSLISYGAAETLTRLTPDFKVEPWLAEKVAQVDATTWRVTLRRNAKFHDGTPVDAEAVAASFKRSWETQPAANAFISKETIISVVDPLTLDFRTPQPNGAFMNNLASFQFAVHKPGPDASTSILTGPYRPMKLTVDNELVLEAFREHWAGPPPIARVQFKLIPDPNARTLALQSGDVDMVNVIAPEAVKGLSGDLEAQVTASARVVTVQLNHARPPFNDRSVREAFALGVDREALNKVGFDGQGKVVTTIFPEGLGQRVVAVQVTNSERAKQLLDQAGWTSGPDGVRVKDGRRLAITLLTYPQRAELSPMAVAIQAQLRPLGFDVQVRQTQDISKDLASGDFDAGMWSVNMLPTGDPLYTFNQHFLRGGDWNYGKYQSTSLETTLERLRTEADPAKRQALSVEIQEILKSDVPMVFLVATPRAVALKKGKVRNFTLHPNDLYFLDAKVAVQ